MTTRRKRPASAWLAWSIWAFAVACLVIGGALAYLNRSPGLSEAPLLLAALAYPTVGALIASRHPHNPIGWLFCAMAGPIFQGFAVEYAVYSLVTRPGSLPGGVWMAWVGTYPNSGLSLT